MADVELIELETIRKFSIATRGTSAPLEEVIGALRADLDALTQDSSSPTVSTEAEPPTPVQDEPPAPASRATRKTSRRSVTKKKTTSGRSGGRQRSRVS